MRPTTLDEAAQLIRESRQITLGKAGLNLAAITGSIDINPDNLSASFFAGTTVGAVQEALAPHGLWWPIDAAPNRTLGAVLATAGPYPGRTAYGRVADWVLGMEMILAGGRRMPFGAQTMKNVAGFDLTRLMVGARGTLGAIGAATLRLLPRPERQVTLLLARDRFEVARDLVAACEWDGARLLVRVDGSGALVARRIAALGGQEAPSGAWDDWYAQSLGRYVRRAEPNWQGIGAPLLGLWRTDEPPRYSPLEQRLRDTIAPERCFNPHL